MPQSTPDSLLSPPRPIAGGQFTSTEGVGLGPPPTTVRYELWARLDSTGEPRKGWVEIYGEPADTPVRLPQSSIPGLEMMVQRHFGDPEIQRELGIDVSGGDLAVDIRQDWHMGLVFGVLLTTAALVAAAVTTLRSRRQATLFRTIAQHEMASREAERTRVAREIHDGPLQDVAALARNAEDAAPTLRAVAAELRAMAAGLRPPALDAFGLGAALEDLAERHGTTAPPLAVRVQTDLPPDQRLPAEVELALYRITQESLSNAVSHGAARTAWVFVQLEDGDVQLRVRDDGRGMADGGLGGDSRSLVAAGHFGLAGMRERADSLGGTLSVAPGPGGLGTEVALTFPAALSNTPRPS